MLVTRRALAGAAVAATVVLTVLGTGAARAAPDGGKGAGRPLAAPLDNSLAPDFGARAKVTASPAASAALATIQGRIADYVAKNGTGYTFGSYLDSTTGRIVLETDAPAGVVAALTDLSGVSVTRARAASLVEVRPTGIAFHRRDDAAPFWGGAGVRSGSSICTTGYALENAGGTRFLTTAGHCFPEGATVLTESLNNTVGVVSNRLSFVELIGGQSYAGRVYTGGVASSTSLPVVGAGGAVVGFADYCHSGRTTGEQCGHTANSTTAQICTASGCIAPVIAFSGGIMPAGGDAGSPFYAKNATSIWIRGHLIASTPTTSYAARWQEVQAAYGATIVLG
ncbi:hypothetical protein WEI85_10085 [Actinomycetes bacterium KLBMP 9797]